MLGHGAIRPVGGIARRRVQGVVDHLVDLFLGDHRFATPAFMHLSHPLDTV